MQKKKVHQEGKAVKGATLDFCFLFHISITYLIISISNGIDVRACLCKAESYQFCNSKNTC